MANTIELKQQIAQGEYDAAFTKLYGAAAVQEPVSYTHLTLPTT